MSLVRIRKLFLPGAPITLFVAVFNLQTVAAHPKEGMWIPSLIAGLNEGEMKDMGMQLTADDLYSVNHSSIKDAIMHFGGGCTSEIVSQKGLLLTNHHCGYSYISANSTEDNDLLANGFWAKNSSEEIPCPGLTATRIVRIEEVTEALIGGLDERLPSYIDSINSRIDKLKRRAVKDTHFGSFIRPFYAGNKYYLFVTETFRDIRFVGTPPSSIGKFGSDADNWMWPRHTGDFSVFRIYASADNTPAEYAEKNVPYKPLHYFPVSLDGVHEGDFTMVYGFPGRTHEYLPAVAVDYIMNVSNPARIAMREKGLAAMDQYMRSDRGVFINYASKYARVSNYWKKWKGENRGLKKLDALNRKKILENKFMKRINERKDWKDRYGHLLPDYDSIYFKVKDLGLAQDLFVELYYYGSDILRYAHRFSEYVGKAVDDQLNKSELKTAKAKLLDGNPSFFGKHNMDLERALLKALLPVYLSKIKPEFRPEETRRIDHQFNGDAGAYVDWIFDHSVLCTEQQSTALINGLSPAKLRKLQHDPLFAFSDQLMDQYINKISPGYDSLMQDIGKLDKEWMSALMTVLPEKNYYPDANGTMRIAYGQVKNYSPADAVHYNWLTTLEGVMEKENPDIEEFNVPSRLVDLYQKKDFGPYGFKGHMPVCFIADNHTTGGNSGSPVLNARGELIGINFDRAWESTMSDIMFDPDRCRNITVDIRYVLFIIDKFAGATHLVNEMTMVRKGDKK